MSCCEFVEAFGEAFSNLFGSDQTRVYRKDGRRTAAPDYYIRDKIPELVSRTCHNTMNTVLTNVVDRPWTSMRNISSGRRILIVNEAFHNKAV